jgi:hypothetical protein
MQEDMRIWVPQDLTVVSNNVEGSTKLNGKRLYMGNFNGTRQASSETYQQTHT